MSHSHSLERRPAGPVRGVAQRMSRAPSALGHRAEVREIVRAPRVQPRIAVGAPDDAHEREADRVADAVMRMPEGRAVDVGAASPGVHPGVQRMCDDCEGEVRRQAEPGAAGGEPDEDEGTAHTEANVREMEESNVRRKAAGPGGVTAGPALETALAARGGGQPLEAGARRFMESRLARDLSHVRVHADDQAARAARSIRAQAFTLGRDIWFGRGQYQPGDSRGQRLLAHELAHTIQQGATPGPQGATPGPQGAAPGQQGATPGSAGVQRVQRSTCPDSCVGPVSRGELCRADSVTRDPPGEGGCPTRNEDDSSDRISHIRVLLDTRKVHLFWNGTPRTDDGTRTEADCSPNASSTPTGWDKIGVKCGPNHTSWARYNMAWFTGFESTGHRIGFHDSQPVGASYNSAGCVRVSCETARSINANTRSGWTSIIVRNSSSSD